MTQTQYKIVANGKVWGPYTVADILRFVAEKRIALGEAIWDSTYYDDVMTLGDWLTAQRAGTLPKPRRGRRSKREAAVANARARLAAERAAFETHRQTELAHIDRLKAEIEGNRGAFFSKPSGPDDLKFFGRILELKGKVSRDDIKASYKRLIAQCHPDLFSNAHPTIRAVAEHQAKLVNQAYAALRKHYGIS